MYWPDTGTGVDTEPARKPVASAVRKYFTEGGAGVPPTVPGGDWFNAITNEVLNVLDAAGIDPSKTDDDQLLLAIQRISKAMSAREALRRTYAEAGFNLVPGSFELGGTVTTATDVLLYEADGHAYNWDGVFPGGGKVVPQGSTPASTGGVGPGLWLDQADATLRSQLNDNDGGGLVRLADGRTLQEYLDSLQESYIQQQRTAKIMTVGAGGDFPTLSQAISSLSEMRHVASSTNSGVEIQLLPGFVLEEQVILNFSDLSFGRIVASSNIEINRSSLVLSVGGYIPALCANNGAKFPVIDVLFDMGWSSGAQDQSVAVLAYGAGSSVKVEAGKGCVKSFGFGLLASNGATFDADGSVWDDCAGDGVSVYSGASGSAKLANADRCYNGFVANAGKLDATSSKARQTRSAGHAARKCGELNAEFADAQGGVIYGFYAAISSLLNVTRGNCSGSRFGISAQRGAKVAAEEVIADNCTETNISARRYAEIEAQSCHAVNTTTTPLYCIRANYSGSVIVESGVIGGTCTDNICRATTNAEIQATDAVMSGAIGTSIAVYVDESSKFNGRRMSLDHTLSSGTAVQVLRASNADITNSTIVAGGNYGVVSQYCANVSADNAEIHGSANYSVYATDGGKMSITNANVRRNVSLDQNTDIVISRGGIISAFGATGGVNTTVNTVSASGTIYR